MIVPVRVPVAHEESIDFPSVDMNCLSFMIIPVLLFLSILLI
ncbi:MAG: hypothetical protein N2Z76_04280 [Treponemataceae bacterium]|nr:hypothetical protein [Treponemataceae bacterium]